MNIQEMLIDAVNYRRQYEQRNQLQYLPETRFKNAFVDLDVALAKLANEMGWFIAVDDRPQADKQELLAQYVRVLSAFLLVANLRNWNRDVLVDDDQFDQLKHKMPHADLSKTYMAIKNMLYAAYFKHSQTDFAHAWKLILKLGLADLNFKADEIADAFNHQVKLQPNDLN